MDTSSSSPSPPQPPSYAPNPPAPRKGLHPLAWVAIGCAALVVVGVVVFGAAGWFALKKGKEFAAEVEKNPAKATAEAIVKLSPDLELVSSDEAAGTMTIRNKKTGEVSTFDYSQVAEGKLSFETASGEGSFSLDAGAGGVTVKGDQGEATFGTGAEELPAWIPRYPGATKTTTTYSGRSGDSRTGMAASETSDAPAAVAAWYEKELGDAGFQVSTTNASGGGQTMASVTGQSQEPRRTVTVIATGGTGSTQVAITYEEGGQS